MELQDGSTYFFHLKNLKGSWEAPDRFIPNSVFINQQEIQVKRAHHHQERPSVRFLLKPLAPPAGSGEQGFDGAHAQRPVAEQRGGHCRAASTFSGFPRQTAAADSLPLPAETLTCCCRHTGELEGIASLSGILLCCL